MKKSKTLWLPAIAVGMLVSGVAVAERFVFSSTSEQPRQYVGEALQSIENFQFGGQVRALANKAIESDPGFAFAHYLVAAMTNPAAEAKPHWEKALELSRKASDGERRYIEAAALVREEKAVDALPILHELAAAYPKERLVQMMLGQAYSSQGKLAEAEKAFARAIELDAGTPRAYALLGNVHLLAGDYGKATAAFKSSLDRRVEGTAPNPPSYGLAFSYLYQGDVDMALRTLELYRDEFIRSGGRPDLPAVFIWNSIARLLLESGRATEAIKTYELGYETVPGSSLNEVEKTIWLGRLHHGRGRSLARMGKHEEAWKEAERIKKMIDEGGERGKQFLPSYHYLAGYIKLEAGEIPAAIEHLKVADQTDPFRKLLLARAYDKAGDKSAAQKIYKEIVDSSQNSMERALAYPEAKKKLASH